METEVESLITEAKSLNLENIGILDRYSLSQIAEIYNGIGPDRFPEWLREMLDELHPSLCVVALIHDLEYYEGGAKEEFTESNERFYRNGKTVAFAKYAWYDPDSHDHESGDSTVCPRTSSRNSSRQIFCCFIYEAAGMPTYL